MVNWIPLMTPALSAIGRSREHDAATPVRQSEEDKGEIVPAGATTDVLEAMPRCEYAQ